MNLASRSGLLSLEINNPMFFGGETMNFGKIFYDVSDKKILLYTYDRRNNDFKRMLLNKDKIIHVLKYSNNDLRILLKTGHILRINNPTKKFVLDLFLLCVKNNIENSLKLHPVVKTYLKEKNIETLVLGSKHPNNPLKHLKTDTIRELKKYLFSKKKKYNNSRTRSIKNKTNNK
jgi:hypothetical protein